MQIRSSNPEVLTFLGAHVESIRTLVKTQGEPRWDVPGSRRDAGWTVQVVPSAHGPIEVLVGLRGLVEPGGARARIERELKKIDKDLAALDKKLGSPGFVDRAPPEVVVEANAQRKSLLEARARLLAALQLVEEL